MPSLTWSTLFSCLTTIKLCLGQNSTKFIICIWGFSGIVVCYFRPYLNLPKQLVSICFTSCHVQQHLILFGSLTESELNKCCEVSSICNSLHIELHLNCSVVVVAFCHAMPCYLNRTCIILVCASCHVYACAFTMLFVSFRCCFLVPVMLRL